MSRTKSFALAVFSSAMLGLTPGCNVIFSQALVGSGVSTTETRETDPFVGLELCGAINAQVALGQEQSIEITGDDNIVPLVITEVHNGTLVIKTESPGGVRMKESLTVIIVTPEFNHAEISGACNVEVEGLAADQFRIDLSGASRFAANGSCHQLVADVSGASKLNCEALESVSAKIDASGASSARITALESLVADASGASSIHFAGRPADVHVEKSGASSIKAIERESEN